MPCACKNKDLLVTAARGIARSNPKPGDNGVYLLQGYEDCTTPYSGVWRAATVFIVGYGTAQETVYPRSQRTDAINQAKTQKLTIDQAPARAMCHDAMIALFGK